MSDNYIRRLNYSNGQLLDVADFVDEQSYQIAQRRLHAQRVHGYGILNGLEVELIDGETDLVIRPGAATDKLGREIVLTGPDPEPVKLKAKVPLLRSITVFLTLAYHEEDDDSAEMVVKDRDGNKVYSKRRVERPVIDTVAAAVTDGSAITLAKVTIDSAGKLALDPSVRTRSGGLHPETELAVKRASAGALAVGATLLPSDAAGLRVEGTAAIGFAGKATARLDVGGKADTDGLPSLQLRSGNTSSGAKSVQLAFGYDGSDSYRHTIRTRHNAAARAGNAIDFYVWRYVDKDNLDKPEAIGSQHTLTLDGGNVGIGTTEPGDYRLNVAKGNSRFDGAVDVTGSVAFGSVRRQMVNLYDTGFGVGVQTNTIYFRSNGNFAWFRGGVHDDAELAPGGPKDNPGKLLMVIASDRVGIGATGPQARLDVEGDAIVAGAIKGRFKDTAGLAAGRPPTSPINSFTVPVITSQNATVLQGWATGATADPAKYPPHLFTLGYQVDGKSPNNLFIADLNTGALKTFAIDHPLDAGRYLLHATLEGPEGAVYYRGGARLAGGRADIHLPPYFEALTRAEGRTVLLTNVDGWDPIAVLTQDGAKIRNGAFVVASSNPLSTQAFDWEVKAVRSDAPALDVEPAKHSTRIERFGPYAYTKG